MLIPVIWKSYNPNTPSRGYWDQALLEGIFGRELWSPVNGFDFGHYYDFDEFEGCILVIAARHHAEYIDQINVDIAKLKWVLLILTGDEEQAFPIDKIKHPNIKIYAQTPSLKTQADRFLVNGYATGTREFLSRQTGNKQYNWAFMGQVTHDRRIQCVDELRKMENGFLVESAGFTLGVEPEKYFEIMSKAKVVPCPSGAKIPDSFRMYEALEAGCLPIGDGFDSRGGSRGYWNFLFGEEVPFPTLEDWTQLPGTIAYFIDTYPQRQNRVFAWWQGYKRRMVYNLEEDLQYLAKVKPESSNIDGRITVLIPTSPTALNPSLSMIEETIGTVRKRLPNSEIIIMIDGVREEQLDRKANYDEYIRRLLWKCNFEYKNVLPLLFETHHHQAAMTKIALKLVKTPCILFVEHDTPLCEEIPFRGITDAILAQDANMIRLHHEALILDVHKDLMLDSEPQEVHGIPMVRTAQWSQRPHVANTEFYKTILDKYFSPDARTMIEDGIHGKVQIDFRDRGRAGWNDWKVWIYAPQGDMKRSYHTDGRGQDSKFDSTFIY